MNLFDTAAQALIILGFFGLTTLGTLLGFWILIVTNKDYHNK